MNVSRSPWVMFKVGNVPPICGYVKLRSKPQRRCLFKPARLVRNATYLHVQGKCDSLLPEVVEDIFVVTDNGRIGFKNIDL